MRVHHLNCASLCPPFASTLNAEGRLVAHVLLLETPNSLVLVDTGLGTADVETPRRRLGYEFLIACGPLLKEEETAVAQIRRLGLDPRDVRHIALTHLDLDHAGGLSDFPEATVHLLGREREVAFGPLPRRHRARYRRVQFAHDPKWRDYSAVGERWFGFEAVRAMEGVGPEVLLVPLAGHTLGHAGVAVRTGDGWLLHAGDAYFHRDEVRGGRAPLVLELFQRVVAMDGDQRLHNRARIAELARQGTVQIFSAHDPAEWQRLAAAPIHA